MPRALTPALNATTTRNTNNASAKEDANKDGNAEDNRFQSITDINKEWYKPEREFKWVLLGRGKKLKAQFPQYFRNMNSYSFLGLSV
ncbi:ADQ_G0022900.mRNA.1.CDS.1 [Saccharomyces cerevisiae]|nr:ADQ_G0022900.mRNA.1.CDS.1 [Saccharomyces cerevisiae]CAI6698337.1 ADQ_G0022900.mRNA.1.CDS.1 [Saccharomyces cerevisiae]